MHEFLVEILISVPENVDTSFVFELREREKVRASELAAAGFLRRLWRPPAENGEWRNLGLWRAKSADDLRKLISTLPLHPWMSVEIIQLGVHPSDPCQMDIHSQPS